MSQNEYSRNLFIVGAVFLLLAVGIVTLGVVIPRSISVVGTEGESKEFEDEQLAIPHNSLYSNLHNDVKIALQTIVKNKQPPISPKFANLQLRNTTSKGVNPLRVMSDMSFTLSEKPDKVVDMRVKNVKARSVSTSGAIC
jgi:hypothetical protein